MKVYVCRSCVNSDGTVDPCLLAVGDDAPLPRGCPYPGRSHIIPRWESVDLSAVLKGVE